MTLPPPVPGPCRITGSAARWPLLDAAAARAHEAAARAACPPGTLMARAGLATARLALALAPRARRVVVLCGPGDNGGDGLVAARHLGLAGLEVLVHRILGSRPPSADTAAALAALPSAGLAATPCPAQLPPVDLAIDALLGLGTTRAPDGELARAIDTLRRQAAPVLAIDLPSGLHPDTGCVLGDAAVVAHATLCPLSLRPGCFTADGRDHAGEVWLDDLGHPATAPTAWLAGAASATPRPHASHKGRFGDVLVVGGATGLQGAVVLAAEAALAAGAGRVFLVPLADTAPPARPELMTRTAAWSAEPGVLANATVVAGCGGGDRIAAALPPLLAHAARLVLDADALNAVAANTALRAALQARTRRGRPTVLTPHPLEAARLLGTTSRAVQGDRFAAATALAAATGAVVLLKGSGSLIASPGRIPVVNPTGNAALASAGTGDVLAGWLGGRWAGQPDREAETLAAEAAWQHGLAADRHAAIWPLRPLRAGELIEGLFRLPA